MKCRLRSYVLIACGWIAAVELFVLVRYCGLESLPQFRGANLDQLDPTWMLLRGLGVGAVMGSSYFLLDCALDRPSIRRRPYWVLIALQTAGNVGLVLVALAILSVVEVARGETQGLLPSLINRLVATNALIALLYVMLVSFLFSFLKTVDRKSGPGNLWKLIVGTYHHPREEELVFMFLDLKGSTTHAERLGHVRFSELIQDCFVDLTVVVDHQASVYQYVGDEVILYWDVGKGVKNANCIRAYFEFTDRLHARAAYYRENYGLAPEFKAGINIGHATVLEVGEIKREISYLGDVLNTAARIQGKCNELQEDLLISGKLKDRLASIPEGLDIKEIGQVGLRGREETVTLFSIRRV